MRSCLIIVLYIFAGLMTVTIPSSGQTGAWSELFNGKDLTGWKQLNGKAEYKVISGKIVGVAVPGEPNSFLCTEKTYGDFILELEINPEPPLNSGIQFRSLSTPEYMNGRVHGYQCEVDPSTRNWSGGIYDEARRGWLYNLSRNPRAESALKPGEWNLYRIEAIGDTIRTWINGIMCANLIDNMTRSGFISLQVHSIGNDPDLAGKKTMFRNIKIMTSELMNSRREPDPEVPEINYIPNTLTPGEVWDGWKLLWDGKTSNGWRSARTNAFPAKGWNIEDGVLWVAESGGGEAAHGGDIISRDQFANFILEVDFMIARGANSGIKYFVDPELNKKEGSAIGLEYQLLDDKNHPDATEGIAGNRTLSSLYDLIPATNLTLNSPDIPFNGVNEWNRARIVVDGNHVEHWLNNFKVVEFERRTQIFNALVAGSKYKIWPNFGNIPKGHILLQDHGNEVRFRSIKIKVL